MRDETKRATESLVVALVFGLLHLGWRGGGMDHLSGGLTLLAGCTFTTGILWAMLALRSLAADGKLGPEIDDGVGSMAAVAWVIALVPPREANFWPEGGVDDFTKAYLPMCLLAVFVMLAAQALFKARLVPLWWLRLLSTVSVSALLLAGFLFFLAGGDDAVGVSLRALALGVVTAVAALVQWSRTRTLRA
jgi:hypothetical protein